MVGPLRGRWGGGAKPHEPKIKKSKNFMIKKNQQNLKVKKKNYVQCWSISISRSIKGRQT